jgi:hypothetical protein
VDRVTLDTTTKQSLQHTRYHAPRQGFNCLAKANSDLSKEIQHKYKNTMCQFSSDEEHKNEGDQLTTTTFEDQAIPHQPNHNIITPAPPSSKYQLKIDGTTYNYLPEALIHRRRTIPPFKKILAANCNLPEIQFDNIAWPQVSKAITSVSLSIMIPIIKSISNEWATGARMQQYY